ncbi:MAG: hypothetical protein O3A84_07415 [Proteobacteria bacterium]|nr:hypothetical protein [Pseudomonadota bacterium]
MSELKKILHVEDDPDILRLVKVALERVGGYTVECHESAQDARVIEEAAEALVQSASPASEQEITDLRALTAGLRSNL